MQLLANSLGSLISIFTLSTLYNSFLSTKKLANHFIILVYLFTALYNITYPIFATSPLSRTLCTFIYLVLPLFIYTENISLKILLVMIYYIIGIFSELLIKSILLGFIGDLTLFYQDYEYHYFFGVIFSNILNFVLIYFLTTFTKLTQHKLPFYLYIFLLLVPISTGMLIYYLQDLVFIINKQAAYNAYCYITFMSFLFNLSIIFTITKISETSWLKAKLNYEQKRVYDQQEYHKSLTDYHQKVRQLYHDLNNHLLIIHHFLEKEDINSTLEYIEKQSNILSQNKTTYTGILLLDTILEEKKQIALRQNTNYQIYTLLDPNLTIDDECLQDICLMLATCLDNALEANALLHDKEKRFIKITLKTEKDHFYCSIENRVHQNLLLKSGTLPKTTKKNSHLHGMGLCNVKELAKKYNGHLFLSCEDYHFFTRFVIKING